ncbi:hypothetical protein PAEH1_01400 [Paenalcaligenes hominis]|uniref:Uncharacterized protein n=1 Tax=Paenalcaligenes hominis TaxID=643674 RepID=A0A1U9JXQ8_9BURK|nr:hypothetical protein PAEH1_01400 [Paenalcaligenes hominis]
MIQCVECSSFSLRDAGQMAQRGCGVCAKDAAYTTYPALREWECGKFEAAPQATTDKRKEWLAR